jgi:hypothetical protein
MRKILVCRNYFKEAISGGDGFVKDISAKEKTAQERAWV